MDSFFFFGLFETGSPCSPSSPRTHSVDEAGMDSYQDTNFSDTFGGSGLFSPESVNTADIQKM